MPIASIELVFRTHLLLKPGLLQIATLRLKRLVMLALPKIPTNAPNCDFRAVAVPSAAQSLSIEQFQADVGFAMIAAPDMRK